MMSTVSGSEFRGVIGPETAKLLDRNLMFDVIILTNFSSVDRPDRWASVTVYIC